MDKFKDSNNWENYIGKLVVKHSYKKFKNGFKINRVFRKTINEFSGKEAFELSDNSKVDCYQLRLATNEDIEKRKSEINNLKFVSKIQLNSYYDMLSINEVLNLQELLLSELKELES